MGASIQDWCHVRGYLAQRPLDWFGCWELGALVGSFGYRWLRILEPLINTTTVHQGQYHES